MSRLPTTALWLCIALGLVFTLGSLLVGASWFGSPADEAPIVWLPALALGLGALGLLVVPPGALLLAGRRLSRGSTGR